MVACYGGSSLLEENFVRFFVEGKPKKKTSVKIVSFTFTVFFLQLCAKPRAEETTEGHGEVDSIKRKVTNVSFRRCRSHDE